MKRIDYAKLIRQHTRILRGLQTGSGLFLASPGEGVTGYDKAWLRDNFYECLAFEVLEDWPVVHKTYKAILDIFLRHEDKIDWAIQNKPEESWQYIHARFHPETFDEFWESWGNKQNDAVGCILFKVAQLENKGQHILANENYKRIVQKLVDYLIKLEYWHDPDSGIWEEDEEVHASSIGAALAGLTEVGKLSFIDVPKDSLLHGRRALNDILPRESSRKFADLALLTLIYPYNIVSKAQAKTILHNVEYHLLRNKGVIRYKGDQYYNNNPDGFSEEAEWTFGLSYLSLIYHQLGDHKKAHEYLEKALGTITKEGTAPELYYSHTEKPNENNPLGWSESMFIVALYEMNSRHLFKPKKKPKVRHPKKSKSAA